MQLPTLDELESAAELVYRYLPPTPQYSWPLFNERVGCEVWAKHENQTPVGAFKVRGGLVYLDWLRRTHPETRGVISATRGNHGQSLAFAARQFGMSAVMVVPRGNSADKNAAMRALGAELVEHGDDFHAADHYADTLARERRLFRVPSFDPLLVRGVGTYALELFRAARNALGLRTAIVGVVSSAAPTYALSFAAGHSVARAAQTRIADGVAISKPHEVALEVLRRELDRIVEVGDDDVEAAMRACYADMHNVVEGAGAAAAAAVLCERDRVAGRRVAVVLSGGNVEMDAYRRVLGWGSVP